MTAAGHGVSEHAVHHALADAEVYHRLVLSVVDAGEFGLLALLFHHLHFLDEFGGDVLGGQLGVVQEEGLSVDGNLGDGFTVGRDGAVFVHLHAGKLLQEVLQHVVVGDLEGGGIVLHRIFLDEDGIAHGAHRGGIQHLLVRLHLDDAQGRIGLELQFLLIRLVAHQLRLEGVSTGLDLFQHSLSVRAGEGILGLALGRRHGNRSKTHGLAVGGVLQLEGNLVILGTQDETCKEACKGQQHFSNHINSSNTLL